MYYLEKTIEISASHFLNLKYESKCRNLHGHNWLITVYCKTKKLNDYGMIADFSEIKKRIMNRFDHCNLNDFIEQPTAEFIARYICEDLEDNFNCYKVKVIESKGNIIIYEKE